MQVFHIAEKHRWEAAQLAGSYAHSTLGRTLEEEGFIHASREDQWPTVRERHYAGHVGELVLLTIDTDRLTSPWREEPVGDESYPHIHGPLNPSAVIEVQDLPRVGDEQDTEPAPTFVSVFLGEMVFRMVGAVIVMVVAMLAGFAAQLFLGEQYAFPGLLAALAAGIAVFVLVARRRQPDAS